jgi:hypothetical protein
MNRAEAIALWDEHTVMGISKPFTNHVDALLAAYQRGIEDAIKAVPWPKHNGHEAPTDYEDGFNACRAETLRRLEGLK